MNTSELPTDQVTIATVYNGKCSLVKLGNPFCIYTFSRYLLAESLSMCELVLYFATLTKKVSWLMLLKIVSRILSKNFL